MTMAVPVSWQDGQLAGGGDDGVLQVRVEDEAVVVAGLGVFQFLGELPQVRGGGKRRRR